MSMKSKPKTETESDLPEVRTVGIVRKGSQYVGVVVTTQGSRVLGVDTVTIPHSDRGFVIAALKSVFLKLCFAA